MIREYIKMILQDIGENPRRDGLKDTPCRVERAYNYMFSGYKQNPEEILARTFKQKYNEIVLLKDIEFYSTCEHHMMLFFGKAHIGYIPNGNVVGISKLARLLECYSRRLQIQERLCNQIVDALQKYLKPKGAFCILEAQHMCMTARGIEKQNSKMITSALRGCFLKDINARQEMMGLVK